MWGLDMSDCITCKYSTINSESMPFLVCKNGNSINYDRKVSNYYHCEFYEESHYEYFMPDAKMNGFLFFKQRKQLSELYEKWVEENGVLNCPMSAIGFLTENGLINVDLTMQYIDKNKYKLDE